MDAMTESNQTSAVPLSASKEKKTKIFYEHGKDALALALSVADVQEQKALRKARRHHQPRVQQNNQLTATRCGTGRAERKDRDRTRDKKKRLEETKAMILKRRAEAKKEKAKLRKTSTSRLRQCDDNDGKVTTQSAPGHTTSAAPRKRVSFA